MTITRWLVTRSLPDPVVASEDPAYNTIKESFDLLTRVMTLVTRLMTHTFISHFTKKTSPAK